MDSVLSLLLLELQAFDEPTPPGLPSLRFQSVAQTWGGAGAGDSHFPTTTSPAPWELRAEGEKTGQRREASSPPPPGLGSSQVIVPRRRLSNPVRLRYTLRAPHPHSWNV